MLTSLDLHYMLKELLLLERSKLSQIYNPEKKQLLLEFHTKEGKKILNIETNNLFLSGHKEQQESATNLAMFLRKRISNAILVGIEQKDFERILILKLIKDKTFYLIIELFSKGNISLTDENYKILTCLENQKWRDREIRPTLEYKFPPSNKNNFLKIKRDDLKKIMEESTRLSIVKTLALDLNLGGDYAEELCFLARLDKTQKGLSEKELSLLYNSIESLRNKKPRPNISNGIAYPIDLKTKKDKMFFRTFSEAIINTKEIDIGYEKKLTELNSRLEKQEQQLKEIEEKSVTYKEIADLIYQNYNKIENLFKQIKDTKWQFNSKEILEKNPNEKKIIIELK